MLTMMKRAKITEVHLGIHDPQKNRHFVTLDGKPLKLSAFVKWDEATGEPNNLGNNEFCVGLRRNGLMFDIPCESGSDLKFICRK